MILVEKLTAPRIHFQDSGYPKALIPLQTSLYIMHMVCFTAILLRCLPILSRWRLLSRKLSLLPRISHHHAWLVETSRISCTCDFLTWVHPCTRSSLSISGEFPILQAQCPASTRWAGWLSYGVEQPYKCSVFKLQKAMIDLFKPLRNHTELNWHEWFVLIDPPSCIGLQKSLRQSWPS